MSFRIYLEIIRAVAVLIVLFILVSKGKPIAVAKRKGYKLILVGYGLIVFASLLDITDNFPALDKYVIIGDTPIQAILEKVIGYLLGFILIAIGFWKWLPGVSELQQTQEELQKSLDREMDLRQDIQNERNQLFTTLHSIGDGVISTDTDGMVLLINPAAEKLTGWTQKEAAGKPITEVFNIVNEETQKTVETPVKKVIETGKIIGLANHTELISKSGTAISIADSGAPVKNMAEKIIGVVLVFRDVSNEKKLFDEKLKLQKLESIGILAGGIAHDFNNLLMGIQGNINLALLSKTLDNHLLNLLLDADKAAQRASVLTQQLLTFSKGGEPNISNIAIDKIVKEAANFVITGTDVKCHFNITKDLWLAQVDKGQISQVIENITINARQAMPKGGEINISIDNISEIKAETLKLYKNKYIRIEINDSGSGIKKDDLSKIFDPYFSTKHTGSGLGLATSFSIIKKHHGYIKVDSKEKNGTTFSIYIPAIKGKEKSSPSSENKIDKKDIRKGNILIMDDEPFIRKLLAAMLKQLGYDTLQANNGQEAISLYKKAMTGKKNKIDLVLLDLTIPGAMGGEETAKGLMKLNKNIKMIVVSGYAENPILSNFKEYGFAAALAKPFKTDELNTILQKIIKS